MYIGNSAQNQGFTPAVDFFSGNASTTAFTLSRPVASVYQMIVSVANVIQNPGSAYTVSGSTVTFTSAPPSGTNNIWVEYTSLITQTIAPSPGTVTSSSINSATSTGSGNIVLATSPTISSPTISTDATIHGLTVGLGGASGAANTAYGVSAIPIAPNSGVVAIGNSAGKLFNTSSDTGQSTFVGYSAGASCVSGTDNTFVGGSAGTNTTGSKNTALGSQALQLNTTASNNTAVGYQALYSNTASNNSVAIGHLAGYSYNGTSGGNNVLVGESAGYALTTGNGNTFIGSSITTAGSGASITTGSKNTILGGYSGNQGGLDIRTSSNYIVLSDGDGNPRGIFDGSGNYLVGVTSQFSSGKLCVQVANGSTTNGISIQDNGSSGFGYIAFANGSGSTIGSIARVTTTNAVVYNTTSDYRLKNVVDSVTGQGERIDALKPIDYQWKDGNISARGFLAHEFQTVYPNSVTGEKDAVDAEGKPIYQAMQASTPEVIADLVAEIQSLRARLKAANIA